MSIELASNQEAKLNLLITAKDEARTVINEFVRSVEESVKSLQTTLDALNKFKFKNPITQSTVDSIKSRIAEINAAFASIGQNTGNAGTSGGVGSSVAKDAAKVKTSGSDISTSLSAIRKDVATTNTALSKANAQPFLALPQSVQGVKSSTGLIESSIRSLTSTITTDSSTIDGDVRGWGKAFATVVHEMEQDANGVYRVVDKLKSNVGSMKSSVDALKTAANEAGGALAKIGERGVVPFQKMEDAVKKAPGEFAAMDAALGKTKKKTDEAAASFKAFDALIGGQMMQQYGKTMVDAILGPTLKAADFNQAIMNIAGSLRAQGESAQQVTAQLKPMNDYALKLGSQGYFSANQFADAMNVMAKQGITYKDVMGGALKAAGDVAAANQEDLTATSNVISDIVHEMGGSLVQQYGNMGSAMGHVGDIMTVALHHSRLSMTDFLNTMKYAGPQASGLGVNFSDLAASIATLGQHGIRGSQAGTTLRRELTNLTPASKAAADEMSNLGFITSKGANVFYDIHGHLKSLADVQRILHDRIAGLTPQMQQFALKTIFGQYALSGMTALVNTTPSQFQAMTDAMAKSGVAQQILTEKSQGSAFQIQHMKAQWETLQKQFGELFLPILSKVIDMLTKFMSKLQDFVAKHPGVAKALGIITAALGGLLLLGGSLLAFAGTIGLVTIGLETLEPVIDALLGPVGIVLLGITAAVALFTIAWHNNWGGIRDKTRDAIQAVVKWFHKIKPELDQIVNGAKAFFNILKPYWQAQWDSIKAVLSGAWTIIQSTISGAWQIISGLFNFWIDIITGHWSNVWDDLKRILNGFKTIITGIFNGVWQALSGILDAWFKMVKKYFDDFWSSIEGKATKAWNAIKNVFNSQIKMVENEWNAFTDTLKKVFQAFSDLFHGNLQGFWKNIVGAFGDGKKTVTTIFNDVFNTINNLMGGLPAKALQWGENMINMLVQGIENKISSVVASVGKVASSIGKFLGFHSPTKEGAASDSDEWMPNMMKMFNAGIAKEIPTLKSTLGGVAMTIKQSVAPSATSATLGGVTNNSYGFASNTSSRGPVTININVAGSGKSSKQLAEELAKQIRTQMAVVSA